jgi:hypothetical protein
MAYQGKNEAKQKKAVYPGIVADRSFYHTRSQAIIAQGQGKKNPMFATITILVGVHKPAFPL